MGIVKGRDLVVLVEGQPLFHATQHQVNLDAEYEEYQTKSVNGKQYALSGYSGTAQADGLVAIHDAEAKEETDFPSLLDLFYGEQPIVLELVLENEAVTRSANPAYITSVSATGSVGQNATYSVSFKFNKLE